MPVSGPTEEEGGPTWGIGAPDFRQPHHTPDRLQGAQGGWDRISPTRKAHFMALSSKGRRAVIKAAYWRVISTSTGLSK